MVNKPGNMYAHTWRQLQAILTGVAINRQVWWSAPSMYCGRRHFLSTSQSKLSMSLTRISPLLVPIHNTHLKGIIISIVNIMFNQIHTFDVYLFLLFISSLVKIKMWEFHFFLSTQIEKQVYWLWNKYF